MMTGLTDLRLLKENSIFLQPIYLLCEWFEKCQSNDFENKNIWNICKKFWFILKLKLYCSVPSLARADVSAEGCWLMKSKTVSVSEYSKI